MAGNYDGSINIDTRIDEKGFNEGIKGIEDSMDGAGKSLAKSFDVKGITSKFKGLGNVLKSGLSAAGSVLVSVIIVGLITASVILSLIISLIQSIVAATISAAVAFAGYTALMHRGLGYTSYMYQEFDAMSSLLKDLKSSIYAAFSPLWIAIEPVVVRIITWFISMINILQQVLAVLLGQSTYMKYVAGSAAQAEKSTGGIAKNTKKAEKAAKGALAAFDEINVLQQPKDQAPETPTGAGAIPAVGSLGQFEEVPVDSAIQEWVDKIKTKLGEAWDWVKEKAGAAWDWIKEKALWVWNSVLVPVWNWLKTNGGAAWDWIKEKAKAAWDWLGEKWGKLKEWWEEHISGPIGEAWDAFWNWIGIVAFDAWLIVQTAWNYAKTWFAENVIDPIRDRFEKFWSKIKFLATLAWTAIRIVWIVAKTWFLLHVFEPLKEGFSSALENIKEKFRSSFVIIKLIAKGAINGIIGFINGMLTKFENTINSIIEAVNSIGQYLPGWKTIPTLSMPQIPKLANGGIIPPNSAFLAMLGDQRSGNNIEAPEELIRQIVREEAGANQDVTVRFAGSLAALVRELKPYIDKEDKRVGNSLVKGAVT